MRFAEWIPAVMAAAAACIGGYSDIRSGKIPNRMTFPFMAAGLAVNGLLGGLTGLGSSVCGILLGFSFFLLFAIGALKAGDVKLYMAVGALGGWRFCMDTMVFSVLIGGAAAFLILVSHKNGRKRLGDLWQYLVNMVLTRRFYMYQPRDRSSYFSYGCCISAGALAALVKLAVRVV